MLRTSIYNMIRNTWKTIRLVTDGPQLEPIYRFGAAVIPVFDRHVAIREQVEMVKKVNARADGPVPITKLLILGGVDLDDGFFERPATQRSRVSTTMPCTVLSFTNSRAAPGGEDLEEAKDGGRKNRKRRK